MNRTLADRRTHGGGLTPFSGTRPASRTALLLVLLLAGGCAESAAEPVPPPPLPGVAEGEAEWFWRDVLAAPLPDETAPRLDLLEREPPSTIIDALADLAESGDPAAPATLMAALRHESIAVACAAAHDLAAFGHRRAIPRLLKGIGPFPIDYDVPIEVRAAQASALARLGNPAGMPLILDLLREGTDLQRESGALQWERTTRMVFIQELALPGLLALAGTDFGFEPNASVPDRQAAVAAAMQWWDERRIALWSAFDPMSDAGLVTRARIMLRHLRAFQLRQIDGARFTLAHLGPGALPLLREGLDSEDVYVRLHVLEILERLADLVDLKTRGRLAVIASGPLLDDAASSVAVQAARVCGAARVVDPLVNALDRRSEPDVRLAIVDALGASGQPAARTLLLEWNPPDGTAAPDLSVALEAARLSTDDGRSPSAFLEMLGSADDRVAFPAVERLIAMTGSDHGVDPLSPPEDRTAALASARRALEGRAR